MSSSLSSELSSLQRSVLAPRVVDHAEPLPAGLPTEHYRRLALQRNRISVRVPSAVDRPVGQHHRQIAALHDTRGAQIDLALEREEFRKCVAHRVATGDRTARLWNQRG